MRAHALAEVVLPLSEVLVDLELERHRPDLLGQHLRPLHHLLAARADVDQLENVARRLVAAVDEAGDEPARHLLGLGVVAREREVADAHVDGDD